MKKPDYDFATELLGKIYEIEKAIFIMESITAKIVISDGNSSYCIKTNHETTNKVALSQLIDSFKMKKSMIEKEFERL